MVPESIFHNYFPGFQFLLPKHTPNKQPSSPTMSPPHENMAVDPRVGHWIRLLQVLYALEFLGFYYDRKQWYPNDLLAQANDCLHQLVWDQMTGGRHRGFPAGWKNARMLTNDEEYIDDLRGEAKKFAKFNQEARFFLHKTADDGQTVQEALCGLWLLLIDHLRTNPDLPGRLRGPETAAAWDKLGESQKNHFLSRFSFDDQMLLEWYDEVRHREVEDPSVRRTQEYQNDLEDLRETIAHDPKFKFVIDEFFGGLGGEVQHAKMDIPLARRRCGEYLGRMWRENHQMFSENEIQDINSKEDLPDSVCPICYETYELPAAGDLSATSRVRPIKTPCQHIMCYSCYYKWLTAGCQNAHRCPTCREDMTKQVWKSDESNWLTFLQHSYLISEGNDPESVADELIQGLTTYFHTLPLNIRDRGMLPEPVLDEDLRAFRSVILGPIDRIIHWVYEGFPDEINSIKEDDALEFITGLSSLYTIRDRLAAYKAGNVEQYRNLCKKELNIYGTREIWHFILEIDDWKTNLIDEVLLGVPIGN